ncbi:MAG: GNAT family N-acetyltransferase [Natronohydrobacter sp.]|nr:GNAT family N-acetyltransferase [Natronohydrobacter sp.]
MTGNRDCDPFRDPAAAPVQWGFALGVLHVGLASSTADMAAVQRLRDTRFRGAPGVSDMDRFDPLCRHLLIRKAADQEVLAAARLRVLQDASSIRDCYTAQFYDLGELGDSRRRCLEIGRICIDAAHVHDPDLLRALLAGLTRMALESGSELLIGCASFRGADPARHAGALRYLAANHIGPVHLRPGRAVTHVLDLPTAGEGAEMTGLRQVPALLRLYLGLGGWVSDHAVIDHELDTLHVFTAVEAAAIPPARLRALQLLARG